MELALVRRYKNLALPEVKVILNEPVGILMLYIRAINWPIGRLSLRNRVFWQIMFLLNLKRTEVGPHLGWICKRALVPGKQTGSLLLGRPHLDIS